MKRSLAEPFRFLLLLGFGIALLVAWPVLAASPRPLRGLWVPRWDLTNPQWVERMVDDASRAGFTALFVQVDGRGEAYYRSSILPPAEGLGDYDPLAAILSLARPRGLAVHAWINAFTVGLPGQPPSSAEHVLNNHPDWVTYDDTGKSLLKWPTERARRNLAGYFLEPGLPAVVDFVATVVAEVAERYPVDGIHLDYIRYPGPDMGYHPAMREEFAARYGIDPLKLDPSSPLGPVWDEWRRQQVSAVVRRAAAVARLSRPGILVSAAVFSDLNEAVNLRFQDWPRWVLEGDLDFVTPMAYSSSTPEVESLLLAGWQAAPPQAVYPGLGAYKFGKDGGAFIKQVKAVLAHNPSGVMVYSYQALQEMPGVLGMLATGPFAAGSLPVVQPAEPPAEQPEDPPAEQPAERPPEPPPTVP